MGGRNGIKINAFIREKSAKPRVLSRKNTGMPMNLQSLPALVGLAAAAVIVTGVVVANPGNPAPHSAAPAPTISTTAPTTVPAQPQGDRAATSSGTHRLPMHHSPAAPRYAAAPDTTVVTPPLPPLRDYRVPAPDQSGEDYRLGKRPEPLPPGSSEAQRERAYERCVEQVGSSGTWPTYVCDACYGANANSQTCGDAERRANASREPDA